MAQQYYRQHALALFDMGYKPIPIRPKTKIPFMAKGESWQVDITHEQVTAWAKNGKGAGGIGLTHLGGIDCDIKNEKVAGLMMAFFKENFDGECLFRIGQAPKFLVPVNSKSEIPKKWKNTWYDREGVKHEIEFLAPGDQYYLGYGIHPDTLAPFTWVDGKDLLNVKAGDLLVMDSLDLAAVEDAFDRLATENGWTREAPEGGMPAQGKPRRQTSCVDPLENLKVPGEMADPAGLAELAAWVDFLPQDYVDDYDLWVSIGAAIHHETAGSDDGWMLFNRWSGKSGKYKGKAETVAKWESFELGRGLASGGNCSARGTIIHALQECGAWKKAEKAGDQAREDSCGLNASVEQNQTCADAIDELNMDHAVVMVGGKCRVMKEGRDHEGNRDLYFMSVPDFNHRYANQKIPSPKDPKKRRCISQVWLESPKRREFDGVVFEPSKIDVPGYYNLWKGLSVQPKKGDWALYRSHIYDIIADGSKTMGDWIIAWMARIVQDPGGKRPGTSIVLKGGQGAGKGIFVWYFGKIFGENYLPVSHASQVAGRFNSHLKDKIIVFIDEGFWAGDKRAEGVLKSIITEPYVAIEQKGMDIIRVKNNVNLIMASNNDWVVPANIQERRFCVLDVNGKRQRDYGYFNAIAAQMDNGGVEAMLYDLLKMDISGVNLKKFEQTKGLWEQKIHTMQTHEIYWLERLMDGQILSYLEDNSSYGDFSSQNKEWGTVKSNLQHEDYLRFAEKQKERFPMNSTQFGLFIKRVCPGVFRRQVRNYNKRIWVREFPAIGGCRECFEKYVNMTIDWGTDERDDAIPF